MATNNPLTPTKIVTTLIYLLILPGLLLFLSGDWAWTEGWIFGIWFLALCFWTISYLSRTNPDLLAERYKKPGTGNQKGWDIYVVAGLMVGFIAWLVIMPLDAKRFGWTPSVPLGFKILGGAGLIFSFYFFFRSYADNTFLSPLVRIQADRKHQVVSSGVYGIVRHPMYLAGSLMFLGAPLLLGSRYGFIIGILMLFLLAGRIIGEEKMLIQELEGYAEYQQQVKYRLIPYVW